VERDRVMRFHSNIHCNPCISAAVMDLLLAYVALILCFWR